jgi:polyphosphate kinase
MIEFGPSHFINRELSWLEFNYRVLEEVRDVTNPLLERIKFFAIFSSNLDEFFEVRVAGLKQQIESSVEERSNDGLSPLETFQAIRHRVKELVELQCDCWRDELIPALAAKGIFFRDLPGLDQKDAAWIDHYYRAEIRPVLTPLALDSAHPFPLLYNKSLNLIVQLANPVMPGQTPGLAIVQVPRNLPRLVRLPRSGNPRAYIFLGRIIGHYLHDLFRGMTIHGYWMFRVTRNSELYIEEEEVDNLLKAVEQELHKRRRGEAIRLETEKGCPVSIQRLLLDHLRLTEVDLYETDGPLNPSRLMALYDEINIAGLKEPPFTPAVAPCVRETPNLFHLIHQQDLLLHHPYDSFDTVLAFMEQAAEDPRVLAIKQTLYRTGGDARIVDTLMRAVNNGKQVTAVVELRARFDEANNIEWARQLEVAGVHVVYGLVGYKIHGKICLVVRREDDGIRRYVHLSTGNYNPITARAYTDLGLFTCRPEFGEDATNLFNLLTGISQFQGMSQFLVSPFELHQKMLALIQRETDHARQGLPARIIAKMNSLVDRDMVAALYRASQAGVKIDLIVRGICCLRPQMPRLSRNLTVRSIVDRFLEHSRIFYFENACQPELYVGSADWMPRSFFRRIELVYPIKDGMIRERIRREILELGLSDNVKARMLQANRTYKRILPKDNEPVVRSQTAFMNIADAMSQGSAPLVRKSRLSKMKLAPRPSKRTD